MKQIKRSYVLVAALALAGFTELQTAHAGVIAPSNIVTGATNYITGDGLVTLIPLAEGLTNGTFESNGNSLFGVAGGAGFNSLGDLDGDPDTTFDREAMDIEFDGTVGLTQFAFVWIRANGPGIGTNGVPSGVVISGFNEDPGIWSEAGEVVSTYTNGAIYFDVNNWSGNPRFFNFANASASKGQVLRLSVNDFDQAGPRLSIYSMTYDVEGVAPPPPPPEPHPPIGTISASNLVQGASSYTTGDGLVSLTPYGYVSPSSVGQFGLAIDGKQFFGILDQGNVRAINDLDGNPFTEDDREALDITLDATVALSEIGFIWSRADGPASNGVPSGIVISGFLEDPVVATASNVDSTYTNGALYLNYTYDAGLERKFNFQNLGASAGQVLRLSVNDFDQSDAQAVITFIAYAEAPLAQSAVLSVNLVSGQVSVTATNMAASASVTNILQGATDLTLMNWVDIGSTSGVDQVTWPVSDSEPNQFFRVKSE